MDSYASCMIEEHTGLPVCSLESADVQLLHANIQAVVDYMGTHHIPRAEWDAPYVYRDYLAEMITANDVAALSRIGGALHARGLDLPPLLAPLYAGEDKAVVADDVYYVAEHARGLVELLGPMLTAMKAADEGCECRGFPWGWLAIVAGGAFLLGLILTAPSQKERGREKTAA